MILEQVNTTGLAAPKEHMEKTDARVVCAQEIGVVPGKRDEISQWLHRLGWNSIIEPSVQCDGNQTSAGAAVCARSCFGLRKPAAGATVIENRAVLGIVEAPGWKDLHVISAYLKASVGLRQPNAGYLGDIGRRVQGIDTAVVIAADFNMPPELLQHSSFP